MASFRPHFTMDLALCRNTIELPTGRLYLLGAGHIQFEVFFHSVTSRIEVEWLVGIPTTTHEMIKNPLCQEKSALGTVRILWYLSESSGE